MTNPFTPPEYPVIAFEVGEPGTWFPFYVRMQGPMVAEYKVMRDGKQGLAVNTAMMVGLARWLMDK